MASGDDFSLTAAALNFLADNVDIVRWVVCLLEGPDRGDCMAAQFDGRIPWSLVFVDSIDFNDTCARTDNVFTYDLLAGAALALAGLDAAGVAQAAGPSPSATTRMEITPGNISVAEQGGHLVPVVEPCVGDACCRIGGAEYARQRDLGNIENALCKVAYHAAFLLHERLHACLGPLNESMDDESFLGYRPAGLCGCDTTDMAEHAFMWAVAIRYPCLQATSGCGWWIEDCHWMSSCEGKNGVNRDGDPRGCFAEIRSPPPEHP